MKHIDAEKLIAEIEKRAKFHDDAMKACVGLNNIAITHSAGWKEDTELLAIITSLQQEQDMGEVSDGYHTFNELYYYRMLYNAAFFNLLPKEWVHKSKRHHTGEECFGGGWFIVMANLPTGQVSNHYELKDWDLFKVPEKEIADEWDGHTPQEAAKRIYEYLQQEQPEVAYIFKPNMTLDEMKDSINGKQQEVELDFKVFAKEMDAVFNLPKEVTENTEENPLNWEYAIARHFAEWGSIHLNARKEETK